MTYALFLALFVCPPIPFLFWRQPKPRSLKAFAPFGVLLLVVYVATIPWDSAAVKAGFWSFDPTKILGIRFAELPIEEMSFFGLQTLLTGLWVRIRLLRTFAGGLS
ncbi:MAG: lycopene cyclase domain-containing protein [Myxococcaceae bacterium]